MSGSGRNSKSLWDMKDERHPPAVEFSEHSDWSGKERRWPSREPSQGNSGMLRDDSINRGRRNSPAFDQRRRRNDSPSPNESWKHSEDNDWSGTERRWPSREPSQGNSGVHKDESISRGRRNSPAFDQQRRRNDSRSPNESWKHRDRGRSRSRSRSRRNERDVSRSRSRDRGRPSERIRSPLVDHRRESFGRMDRRGGTGISSLPCKFFAAGRCNKGNQCKFLHQDNPNYQDGNNDRNWENGPAERYRTSRPEHGRDTNFGNDRETNRYTHHGPSGDNYERGNRNASYDHDRNRQQGGGRDPCKYFLMGKCHKDDCRFSHDGPISDNVDGRSRDGRWDNSFDEKKKAWDGPTWDATAAGGVSDISKSSAGWGGGGSVGEMFHDPPVAERRIDVPDLADNYENRDHTAAGEKSIDDRRGHKLDEKTKSWNDPKWDGVEPFSDSAAWGDGSAGNGNFYDPMAAENQSDDRQNPNLDGNNKLLMDVTGQSDTANFHDQTDAEERIDDKWNQNLEKEKTEFLVMKKLNEKEEILPISQNSQLSVLGDVPIHVHAQNLLQQISYLQQQQVQQGGVSIPITDDSKGLNLNDYSIAPQPPSSSSVTCQSLPLNPPNGHNIDLNDFQPKLSPSDRQEQPQSPNEETVEKPEKVEFKVPQVPPQYSQNVVTSEKTAHATNLSWISPNGQQLPQPYTPVNPQIDSMGIQPNKTGNSSKLLEKQGPIESLKVSRDIESKQEPKNMDGQGKVDSKDEKALRLFKVALVEFVKEILKPKWKEGQMSREVHKTIVKKTVDKVTSTIQGDLLPKTQDKIEQYLAFSKEKITKLVQAYVERFLKVS